MYEMDKQAYLEIDKDMVEEAKTMLAAKATNFWMNVIPGLLSKENDWMKSSVCVSSATQPFAQGITFLITFLSQCYFHLNI